ncbi:MAG: hypothetical protein JWN34_4190 [Bryobacterales bacterium]|nr:hypothetical protein [Bryobacterales bacterium]
MEHITQAIANIRDYTAGMDAAAYLTDRKTQDAVIRNFEVIGEACNNITKRHQEFAASHPEIPWNFAYEMRNALAHGYFKIDQSIVWRTIQDDLPDLIKALHSVLNPLPPV